MGCAKRLLRMRIIVTDLTPGDLMSLCGPLVVIAVLVPSVELSNETIRYHWRTGYCKKHPLQSHGVIRDHTVLPATRRKRTGPALTPSRLASTRFTYLGRMARLS